MESEEDKVIKAEGRSNVEVITAFNRIPYALISQEIEGYAKDVLDELTEICTFYKVYDKGEDFVTEGSHGDYVPAQLHYKLAATLVDKEARFLFASKPDITVQAKADAGDQTDSSKESIENTQDLLDTVLRENNFEDLLLKAAKDCFIGKRVACLVNFNEEDGVTVTFLPATQFIYETKLGNPNVLTKFVCFLVVKKSKELKTKRIFKKKLELGADGFVYLEEKLFDGTGREIEEITPYQQTKLSKINAVVFVNDGLTGDDDGDSEIRKVKDYEQYYSKLANADIDAERKGMNPIRYTIDMSPKSTQKLSSGAGSYWDLAHDTTDDSASPQVGVLEASMGYSESLKTSLERIKAAGFEQLDVPNITIDSMTGVATTASGKALRTIYWPLIVRCSEKMKMWGPKLREVAQIIIEGAKLYPNCIARYVNQPLVPVDYEVVVENNIPIPEDESDEKQIDLAEVESQVMSRKSYMKKWYGYSDTEVEQELAQIALERQVLEDSAFSGSAFGSPYSDEYDAGNAALQEQPISEVQE